MEWKIIDVEDKQEWSKYATLRDTRNDWKEGRGASIDGDTLVSLSQVIFEPVPDFAGDSNLPHFE